MQPSPVSGSPRQSLHPHTGQKLPGWFTPTRLLIIFCITNLFVYLDRGLIASNGVNGSPASESVPNGSGIQGAFSLSYFEDGLIPAAFMVGLLVSSPIFAEASKTCNAFRLLALGMGIWMLACFGCALAPSFQVLIICRVLVGVGEASFVSLAAPFIDDWAPINARSLWFACFYLCIPVGFAFGYIMGGIMTVYLSWRWTFALEAAMMIPFVLFAATAQPLQLHGDSESTATSVRKGAFEEFWADIKKILSLRTWLTVDVAYTFYVAVMGVYAFWGPQAGHALFFRSGETGTSNADLSFGGVTVFTGVVGCLSGGLLLDRIGPSLQNACRICVISNLSGFVFAIFAFTMTKSFTSFILLFGISQLCLFTMQSPMAALGMWCVPSKLRPLGISLMTVTIHLFGDVPSPPLLGLIQTELSKGKDPAGAAQQWRVSMSLISMLLLFSGALFSWATLTISPGSDFRLSVPKVPDNLSGVSANSPNNNIGTHDEMDEIEDAEAPLLPKEK